MVVLSGRQEPGARPPVPQPHARRPRSPTQNFGYIGYQPPQNSINPDSLVADGFIPENLRSAIVQPEYFDTGYRLLGAATTVDAAWHEVWQEFKAGGLTPAAARGADAPAVAAARRAPGSSGCCCSSRRADVRRAGHRVRSDRPDLPHGRCRCGTRCSGTPPSSRYVLTHIVGEQASSGRALLRTVGLRRHRQRAVPADRLPRRLLRGPARRPGARACCWPLLIAPFWISYMMRMFAWVNLLQNDGLVNRLLSLGGLFDVDVDWLTGQPVVGGPRAGLRLRAVHDPAAVRRPGPAVAVDAGGVPRPGCQPVLVVLAGDAADVPADRSSPPCC